MIDPTTWRIEQLKTRIQIYDSQSRFLLGWAAKIWLLGALSFLYFGLTRQGYQPFQVRWIFETYTLGILDTWLLWAGIMGFFPLVVVGVLWWRWMHTGEEQEQYLRGAELLTLTDLNKRLRNAGVVGVPIGETQIPEQFLSQHIMVFGATGSGKSVTIRTILQEIKKRQEAAIVFDPEGEFLPDFFD